MCGVKGYSCSGTSHNVDHLCNQATSLLQPPSGVPKRGYSVETDLCNQATSLVQPLSGVPKRGYSVETDLYNQATSLVQPPSGRS